MRGFAGRDADDPGYDAPFGSDIRARSALSRAGLRYADPTLGATPALKPARGRNTKNVWTLSTCFAHFGAARSLRHFGGSAISDDGTTVVVAMWEDEIVHQDDGVTYRSRFGPPLRGDTHKVSKQWISHLKWAIAHCDSVVRVVVLAAEDMEAQPRVVRACYPDDSLVMQITSFDEKTGFFEARMPGA
jgi:hypothetical protein